MTRCRRSAPATQSRGFSSPQIPDPPVPFPCPSAPASPPVRPVICTSAGSARPCSAGSLPGGTAASSSCGSTTPTRSGTSRRPWRRSSTACAGWGSTGTKAPRSAGRTPRIISRSGPSATRRRSSGSWPAGAAYRDYATPEELQAERQAAEQAKRPFLYSRRFMAETAAELCPLRGRGPPGRGAAENAPRGHAGHRRPGARPRRGPMGPRAGPRHPAGRRHLPLSPGQRGGRLRVPDHAT